MSSSSISESSLSSSSSSIDSSSSSYSESSQSKSTSSISTNSSSSSSLSSQTSLSSSSTSKSTSSSSSSFDSSSTSSESVGNVSTSSSSSFGGWNKSKPLILGMSAINSIGITNKLAQTISIVGSYYSIGKVFCYFYGPYGFDDSFTIHLGVYLCNDNGEPTSSISSTTLSGSSITGDGWYSFDVDLYGETPLNKYLSFVVWQENGNEDDYVLWGHNFSSVTSGTKAIFTSDGATWQYQEGVIRSLKLIGDFDAYDLEEFKIITPPAEQETITGELEDGEFDGTKYENGKVVIDNPDFIASFIIDSSGSMGWNDRFDNRIDFVNSTIQKIKENYSGNVIFDIVKFGSQIANTSSIVSSIGSPTYININLATPSRNSFLFSVTSANASVGDIYENNNYSFTVSDSIVSGDSLACSGNSTSIPFDSGELVLLSGTGDPTISFSSYNNSSIGDRIIAYGFKNFEEDDPCNLADISIGGLTYETSLKNWQTLSANGETELSIGNNGPNNSQSIDFISSENLVLRRPISPEELVNTKLSNNASVGDTSINVDDATIFLLGDYVDIVDKDLASINHKITNVASNTITVTPSLVFNIGSWINNGGIVQKSNLNSAITLRSITSNILFRDIYRTRNITFFLQTENGLLLEYDISLFKEWFANNIYFTDETAILPISIFDTYNNPFPDGTKVVFYVGGYPEDSSTTEEIPSQNISENASIGDNKIYLDSTDDYSVGIDVDILNNLGQVQTVLITEIGEDITGKYIKVDPVLIYNFNISDGSKIIKSLTASDSANASSEISSSTLLSAGLSIVDITPIRAGRALNPVLAKPYDITPTDPNMSYDELNLAKDLIRNNISDIPSIDGFSAIRILPITEDNLKTSSQKSQESTRLLRADYVSNYTDQQIQNSDDIQVEELALTTTTTTLPLSKGEDYNIDNPIYLSGGYAQSGMTTFATQLTEESFNGINVAGVDQSVASKKLVKEYTIYPAVINDEDGSNLYKQYLSPFIINFTPPYAIYSDYIGGTVSFVTEKARSEECPDIFEGYQTISTNGVYASGDGFKIKYVVTNKNEFSSSGQLTIRIYSNTVIDISSATQSSDYGTRQDLNVVLPKTSETVDGVVTITQPLTDIDEWRSTVESNPFSQLIETSSSGKVSGSTIISQVKEDLESFGYENKGPSSSQDSFSYYSNPLEWTKATQYGGLQETTIDIVNGEAILDIPSSDISALLVVQASIYFGENNKFEFIRSDVIPVANPIEIGAVSPLKIFAEGGDITYEIGAFVTWMKENIADNVIVSYSSGSTPILPSVSKTDDGWAGGLRIGPHDVVKMNCPSLESASTCACYGAYEELTIFISYLGYTKSVKRIIEWTGYNPEDDEEIVSKDNRFYFHVTSDGGTSTWSDGNSLFPISVDLNDSYNEVWIEQYYPNDERNRDRIKGYEQNLSKPNLLTINEKDLYFTQSQSTWIEDVSYISVYGLNRNIGHKQEVISLINPFKENSPWSHNISILTQFRYYDENGKTRRRYGIGVSQYPYEIIDPSTLSEVTVVPYPQVEFSEPLSISVSLEAYDNEFIRDGLTSANIVADVKWQGEYLNGKFIKNEGKLDEITIDYPFPNVTFEAGICKESNRVVASEDPIVYHCKDTRNSVDGCLTIESHEDVTLSSYSAVVGLYRTDIYNHGTGTHTHACVVDSNGEGITSETILMSGVSIADHEHVITNYVAASSGTPSHEHSLRSVAIVQLNPIINSKVNIAINGYVVYDPTGCEPYSYDFGYSSSKPISFSNGNRMMFSSLYINSQIIDRRLVLELSASNGYTARSSTDTERGIDIVSNIYFSEYSEQDSEGNWSIVPSAPIPDGTRIIWSVNCFKAISSQESTETLIMRADAVRKYMYIRAKATVYIEDLEESAEQDIIVSSNIMWIPSVSNLLIEPTDDDIYVQDAMSMIDEIGSSQIHDAVKFASQRIIQYQTDYPEWKSAKKAIFLLTDGDENTSEYSINQAIDNVNNIDGNCEVPVIPVRLGFAYGSDDVILNKYSKDTCGKVYYMINAEDSDINSIIDDIVADPYMKNNSGVYSNTIDLLSDNLINVASLLDIVVPLGGRSLFRYRYSSDLYSWSNWSEWVDTSYIKEFDSDIQYKCRYFQYQVKLFGNETYDSPEINSGLKLDYYKAQTFTVFFQPIDLDINYDEYLSSIHITHKASIPSTSSINYGYTQFNSVDIEDYASVTRPWITPDRHTIILTRYNEKTITKNYKKYTAINGGWASGAIVEVYKVNSNNLSSQLMPSSEYSINNKTGDITFFNTQNKSDVFIICIYFDPAFRLVCNTFNYGPEVISIDHIGVMYNIGKRIPTLNNGNIIHTPISERI